MCRHDDKHGFSSPRLAIVVWGSGLLPARNALASGASHPGLTRVSVFVGFCFADPHLLPSKEHKSLDE